MGAVKQWTGIDLGGAVSDLFGDITGANAQAAALKKAAEEQANATRQSAELASNSARESAKQSATMQAQTAARNAALASASDEISKAPANPDVQLAPVTESASGAAKKRREKFGIGSKDTGVQI